MCLIFFINSNILREAGQFDLAPDQYSLHSRPASQTGSYRYLLLITGSYYLLLAKKLLLGLKRVLVLVGCSGSDTSAYDPDADTEASMCTNRWPEFQNTSLISYYICLYYV